MHHQKLFSDKSDIYAAARPTYPDALYDFLLSLCNETERAWDGACGSGQAAIGLSRHFGQVYATDVSAEQIANAKSAPNIMYGVGSAENPTFPNNHFDLVCIAQALHWFDYDKFWVQVQRVLKPNGVFAAWGYSWFTISPAIDNLIQSTLLDVLQPFWATQNKLLWDNYIDVPFPLTRLDTPPFRMSLDWDLDGLFNYLHSWSAVRRCMDTHGDQFFQDAYQQVSAQWGDPTTLRTATMEICLLVGTA